jgi:undecaprenyl-diphosphatase
MRVQPPANDAAAPAYVRLSAPAFFVAAVMMGAFFAVWTWLVHANESLKTFDQACAEYWRDYSAAHPNRLAGVIFLTDLGGVPANVLITILGALWQASLRNRLLTFGWIVIMIGCGIANTASKHLIDIERPGAELRESVVRERNPSYPSGHSMGSAVGYGMLAYTLVIMERRSWLRFLIPLISAAVVLGVGFSRIYLRAHWFSDVIAGWSIGLCWLFLCLGCLERWRRAS